MTFNSVKSHSERLPRRIVVKEVLSSRYPTGVRPESWDLRHEGAEFVRDTEGQTVKLWSDGQQSPPQKGWSLMLREGEPEAGYKWTLYGIER